MIDVDQVLLLHQDTVKRWHDIDAVDQPYPDDGVWTLVCEQHAFNYRLWHQEDIARSRDVSNEHLAQVKRNIDKLNQQRNDWIEKVDDWITEQLSVNEVDVAASARLNTETPGSVIDRLSILALRIYHMHEQAEREDVDEKHLQAVQNKLALCYAQQADLSQSLKELLDDIASGAKRHRTYRQMKMYNDPSLNPYLYKASQSKKTQSKKTKNERAA